MVGHDGNGRACVGLSARAEGACSQTVYFGAHHLRPPAALRVFFCTALAINPSVQIMCSRGSLGRLSSHCPAAARQLSAVLGYFVLSSR